MWFDTWKTITIPHFLSHTSGVVRESPGFDGYLIQLTNLNEAIPAKIAERIAELYLLP